MSPSDLLLRAGDWPLLLLAPAAWLLFVAITGLRRRRLARALGPRIPKLTPDLDRRRRRRRHAVFSAGLFLALLAALEPVWGEGTKVVERRGVDIVVCLDVSRSMLARDVAPSRLQRAKREIRELADRAEGDRLGLVVFAGEARLLVPLTSDRESFREMLKTADPLSVPRGGTDLAAALRSALGTLASGAGDHEVVVLVTDGDDLAESGPAAVDAVEGRGVTVHAVGLGAGRGAKIPVPAEGGETFLRDPEGREVVTSLDAAGLRRIAGAAGGRFVDGSGDPGALVSLYEDRILPMERKSMLAERRRERENRYQWPLLAAFLLFAWDLCTSDRKRS